MKRISIKDNLSHCGYRRNLAKAKSRDAIRKMQTRHFLRQQHQILNYSLQNRRAAVNEVPMQRSRTVDFTFAHARRDMENHHEYTGANGGTMILCKPARGVLLSDANSSPREKENSKASKSSKILKALNDNDRKQEVTLGAPDVDN